MHIQIVKFNIRVINKKFRILKIKKNFAVLIYGCV